MGEKHDRTSRGGLRDRVGAAREFLAQDLWSKELGALPRLRAFVYKVLRVLYLTGRGFERDRCLMRAAALTFMTGLSLVPLLAFAFAVAKGLGAYDALLNDVLNPFLDRTLGSAEAPDGYEARVEVRAALNEVLNVVQRTDVRSLGTFGLLILVYTIIKLLGSIEQSFNEIWGVHKARSFVRKVSDYLSILVIVPILLTTATAVTTAVQSDKIIGFLRDDLSIGRLAEWYATFSSMVAVWVGFMFVYLFMPNTRVRIPSALLGGIAGGTLWQLAQVLHVRFQVGVANYNAIYSTFAALPIFMFWLYLSWVTVLLGAEVAYAHQSEPAYRQIARARRHGQSYREIVAVRAVARVAVAFVRGDPPVRSGALASELAIPERTLEQVLVPLRTGGVLAMAESEDEYDPELLPARDLDHITIQDVLDALAERRGPADVPPQNAVDREVDRVFQHFLEERASVAHNLSFRRLAARCLEAGEELPSEGEARAVLGGA